MEESCQGIPLAIPVSSTSNCQLCAASPRAFVAALERESDFHMTASGSPDPTPSLVIPVVAGVIRRGKRVLLALRPPEKRHGGRWEFPGGKLGEGESDRDALVRELREELGVTLRQMGVCRFTAMDPGSPFQIRFWEVEVEGEPEALEHEAVGWFRREEAGELPMAPADRKALRVVLDPN